LRRRKVGLSTSIKDSLATNASGGNTTIGPFILRVFAGLSLFLKHGLEKLTGYSTMVQQFPDPIHIGAHASLAFALLVAQLAYTGEGGSELAYRFERFGK
jgi:uncharacterized membrane protein YphA (DoxX/SURF4 family)